VDSTLTDIFDFGKGIFKQIADLELGKLSLQLAQEARADEAAVRASNEPRSPGALAAVPVWVWYGAAGLAAFLVVRKLV
jgi:hypothetical protein